MSAPRHRETRINLSSPSLTNTPSILAGSENATVRLAEWASGVTQQSLPSHVAHHGRRLIIDYLAAATAGSTTELSQKLRNYFAVSEPGSRSTSINGPKLTATAAAYVNAAAAHGLELDDGYTPGSVHPGACVVPAVLALAEDLGSSIADAAVAVIIGVEVTARIAAAGHPSVLHAGFHNTPVAGVFGAAVGSGWLLGLDSEAMAGALGLAGSYAGGLREYHAHASEVKRLHTAKAARDGLKCAELAAHGIYGPSTVLEGENGYFAAFARGQWKPEILLDDLGKSWASTRTYVKPYPCCRHLHGAIDAALQIRSQEDFSIEEISAIEIGTFGLAAKLNRQTPQTLMAAQFSLPFAVATALTQGSVDLASFSPEGLTDPKVQQLTKQVSVHLDEQAQHDYPRSRAAEVTVTLTSGEVYTVRVEQPLGEPDNPLSDEAIESKFRNLAIPVLGLQRVEDALDQAWRGNDITTLTSQLGESE